MQSALYISCLLFLPLVGLSQKNDYNWIIGYRGQNPHPLAGNMELNFSDYPMTIQPIGGDSAMYMLETNASISDNDGNLLFYSNGVYIADSSHHVMERGDNINDEGITNWYDESGLSIPQGLIILPVPGSDSLYYLFHEPVDFDQNGLSYYVPMLLYSVVDMSLNGGKGAVIEKDEILILDTLAAGKITACKHANGRDWWIIVPEYDDYTNVLYTLLLTPDGVVNFGKLDVGPGLTLGPGSVGNAVFSPDGTKYIKHDIRFDPWNSIDTYDFDRCSGSFEHLTHFLIGDTTFIYGGAAVSSDSKYLYCITNNIIYQFDLTASNIESTKTVVAEYDGHIGLAFPSLFGVPQTGPDGSIYVASVADTIMHVIRTPNQPGLASHVEQHSIILPKINQKSIPNFPNFRLGPLDGSPCDTLGLDNFPVAGFTYYAQELAVTFSDNSYYRPEAWAWDFGDTQTSSDRNPLHAYAAPGEYHVCLTVSNEYGSDTFCRWVVVDTVAVMVDATTGLPLDGDIVAFPNPAHRHLVLRLPSVLAAPAVWSLWDATGREVWRTALPAGRKEHGLALPEVPDGLYFWQMTAEGRNIANGKLVIGGVGN